MKKVLISGSQGFIGSYLCQELLEHNYVVIGVDNYSKYGYVHRPHDKHPLFQFHRCDVTTDKFKEIVRSVEPDYILAVAAMIGGIGYFHRYAYDLLATNERITANTFDAAIDMYRAGILKKMVAFSSSMVFEATDTFPSKEEDVHTVRVPLSTYGFQKLAVEYFCKGAKEQYGLPSTLIRPYNAVGTGEDDAIPETDGNREMTLSHVLPDLIIKIMSGQYPLRILGDGNQVRCYTNGKDIARGVRLAMESEYDEDFNISSPVPTSVLELAQLVWSKLRSDEFKYESDSPLKYDVQYRLPDVSKAERLLGFKAEISLEESVDEVIAYLKKSLVKL